MPAETGPTILILGVGNADRGDDGVGPLVAARLAEDLPPEAEARAIGGDAAGLIEAWQGRDLVVLVDAVVTGLGPAGTVHRWDAGQGLPAVEFERTSSHGFGLGQAIELARALGRLPARVIVYGVEAERFEPGQPPGAAVAAAADRVAEAIRRELSEIRSRPTGRDDGC